MWSSFATVLAIAIAANLDNAGVGIAYGVRKIHISWYANLLIAIISGAATYLAGLIGHLITRFINAHLAAWIGAVVIVLVGIWVLTEPWRAKRAEARRDRNVMSRILRDPSEADFDNSQTISISEASVLGIALAMNALAGGFDAGVVHIGILWTAVFVGVFSYTLLGVSAFLGSRYASYYLGNKATYIAGILLILIGIHQIW